MTSKVCTKCKVEKAVSEFSKNLVKKDALCSICKKCDSIRHKSRYKQNTDKLNKKCKDYYRSNATRIKQKKQSYYIENINRIKIYQKEYVRKNRLRLNEKQNNRRADNFLTKFSHNIRSLLRRSFKRNKTKNFNKKTKTEALLGCTIVQLHEHLAKQFKPGMSLENHGKWHIDHIIPLASAKTQAEIEALCHYTNLQPLWAKDNLSKGSRHG